MLKCRNVVVFIFRQKDRIKLKLSTGYSLIFTALLVEFPRLVDSWTWSPSEWVSFQENAHRHTFMYIPTHGRIDNIHACLIMMIHIYTQSQFNPFYTSQLHNDMILCSLEQKWCSCVDYTYQHIHHNSFPFISVLLIFLLFLSAADPYQSRILMCENPLNLKIYYGFFVLRNHHHQH